LQVTEVCRISGNLTPRVAVLAIIRNVCRGGNLAAVDVFTPCFMYY
jgi:hypothetical protein